MPIKIIFSLILLSVTLILNGCYGLLLSDIKSGDDALRDKRYYDAAKSYIHAIASYDNNNTEAKNKLASVGAEAYNQKAAWAAAAENSGSLETAYTHYNELGILSDELQKYAGFTITTVDTNAKKSMLGKTLAEKYYTIAEGAFRRQDYTQAINQYKQAQSYMNPYRDSNNKIAESYYQLGLSMEHQGNYHKAYDYYTASNNTITGYKDANRRAKESDARAKDADASIYYNKGKDFAARQQYAEAITEMKNAQKYVPHFRDTDYMISQYDAAIRTKKAEEAYIEGLKLMAGDKYQEAIGKFNESLTLMPTSKYAQDARDRVAICREKAKTEKD